MLGKLGAKRESEDRRLWSVCVQGLWAGVLPLSPDLLRLSGSSLPLQHPVQVPHTACCLSSPSPAPPPQGTVAILGISSDGDGMRGKVLGSGSDCNEQMGDRWSRTAVETQQHGHPCTTWAPKGRCWLPSQDYSVS